MRVLALVSAAVVPEPELCCGWETGVQEASGRVEFVLEAERSNRKQLEQVALAVSDPRSEYYGQFRSQAYLDELTKPAVQHVAQIRAFLAQADAEVTEVKGRRFEVSCSVAEASKLFATSFRTVVNGAAWQRKLRAGAYRVPDALAGMVVFGLHGLPLPPKTLAVDASAAKVTPGVIADAYGVAGVKVSKTSKNRQAVAEFQGQTMKSSDLATFFKSYVKNYEVGTDDKVDKFVGDAGEGSAQVEASLDIQYIMGVAPGVKTEFWLYNPSDFCADLKKWTTAILADDAVPLVHSVSYGWQGQLSKIGCSAANSDAVDGDLAQLAAKGITIIFASGDSGSGVAGLFTTKLYPSWPASSPWVTSVGATRFVNQPTASGEEMASDQFGSGGGFSWDFDRSNATWQEKDVQQYLGEAKAAPKFPPSKDFHAAGRGTPDVSALGEGFQVYVSGSVQSVGGTSASAPTFAGLISLLNEARLQKGQKQLGFLNPWIYQHESLFTDITKGTNAIGRGTGPSKFGYACEKGWDAATGVGTPKFGQILAALQPTNDVVV